MERLLFTSMPLGKTLDCTSGRFHKVPVLLFAFRFLFEVQLHSKVNKMNVENLATVMGINLLKPQIEDPITVMKGENTVFTDVY